MTQSDQDWHMKVDKFVEGNAAIAMSYHFEQILTLLGEDTGREGLLETPRRIAKAWIEMTQGLHEDPKKHLEKVFTTQSDAMVIVKDIPFTSICEHHFVPFLGKAHVGYIPGGVDANNPLDGPFRIAGLSKFARLVHGFAQRPQVQEILTEQVADSIEEALNPQGVIVVMEAQHMCMSLRGVKAGGSTTVTNAVRGLFATNEDGVKQEFFGSLAL